MAVVLVEVAAAGFGLAVVAMVGELAWNLFPSSVSSLDVEGDVVLFVHRHGPVAGLVLVLGHVVRCSYVFARKGPSATARLPVWGAWYVCQILATTVLFFVAVYTVLINVLPRE